jgi:hypothetical protein
LRLGNVVLIWFFLLSALREQECVLEI